jgi:hypothetical protein
MLPLLLTLVLSSTNPPAVETWAQKACPSPRKEPDSNVEFKAALEARAQCLKKAMNQSLDRVLVPLKKKEPSTFKQWMGLQADYNRWVGDACAAVEEANWVDLSTGERSMGTGYGGTEMECHQRQYAWRGFYADAWARGDWKAISAALDAYAQQAPKRADTLSQYQKKTQALAAQAPVQAEPSDTPSQRLSRDDWKDYNARLGRAASEPQALAERQCALVPKAAASCAESFRASLTAQMDFSDALAAPGSP